MPAKKNSSPASQEFSARPGMIVAIRVLSAGATALALYLAALSLTGGQAAGCGPDSGCHEVLRSRWAYWFGLPVSLLGVAAYSSLFLVTFKLGPKAAPASQRWGWTLLFANAALIVGAALWFLGVQWIALKKYCPYCLAAHGAGVTAAILALLHAPIRREPDKTWQKEKWIYLPPALALKLTLGAIVGWTLLAGGQFLHEPKRFVIKNSPGILTSATTTTATAQTATASAPSPTPTPSRPPNPALTPSPAPPPTPAATVRVMQLFNNQVELNLSEVPRLGRADAPHVMVGLHDYTCHHCRAMHEPLKTLQHAFSNELTIISLPMPLDSACNHRVITTPPPHASACEYAKLSLAIWRAKPDAFEAYEDFLFAPASPPPVAQAYQQAERLAGNAPLLAALQDPWVTNQIQKNVAIYDLNIQLNQNSSMPQFIVGTNVIFGSLPLQSLFETVTNQFRLRWPPVPSL